MPHYRLLIERHGRLLGHFDTEAPWARDAIRDLMEALSAADGYRLQLQVPDGERRILQSGPDGIRVLSREPLFTSCPPDH